MNPQEQQMIAGLIQRVENTPLADKDPEAERYLQQGLGRNPDALYVLAQTVLVQGYALEQAQKQLADLRAQAQQIQQQPPKHTSFLGSIFGSDEPARPAPLSGATQPGYAPVPNYGPPSAPAYAQPVYQQAPQQAGGGFLRGAMQTAAGVAAGAVAFEGIESLMHGFGGHGGGSSFGSFGGGDAPREEIVNNYYGDRDQGEHGHERGFAGNDDIEDRRDDTTNTPSDFADTSGDDDASSDDFSSDDSGDSGDAGSDDSSFS